MADTSLAPASSSPTLACAYRQFNDLTRTKYTHSYIEQPPRLYYYDCVGFTGYTVRIATPTAWTSLVETIGLRRGYVPSPLAFETFFKGLATESREGWQAVPSVRDIRAGDVLAWQPANAGGGPDTAEVGHSVMPLVAPRAIPGSGDSRWEVVVMDSTVGGHGPHDTRSPANALSQRNAPFTRSNGLVQPSGLGIGTIVLDAERAGTVTGIEWHVGAARKPVSFGAGRAVR